ncbi:putative Protein-glutamine gamma-glutamyltransferase [Nitrospira tepida]|uniref:Transglutaminase-like domain-containing protein n=1 Tax=Nitrospira tepida TaxID=2973512 RepID=A0AA86MW46_9BACT|nr:DUF3488 and transglutaminase-like domain-containing protein [Nitrospira tepida]CAI4030116.1 putative Protein-glutamine gamma-glutamyltransferase [Nitrospira tepida]
MDVTSAFRLSSLLLATAAFTGLALTASLPPGFLFLGFGCLLAALAAFAMQASSLTQPLGASLHFWNVLIMVAFIWFWIDYLWFSNDLLHAGVHFLIGLMVNKLFNLHQRRDYLQLYAISFIMILASAAMTTEVWYGTVVVTYLLIGVWTLLLYQLVMEADRAGHASGPEPALPEIGRITAQFFWSTNGLAAGALAVTLIIFFTFPRIGVGLFQKNRDQTMRTVGFTEKVDLGVMGPIKLDESVVMRMELPGRTPSPESVLYLRGMAYDWYNGTAWVNTFRKRRLMNDGPSGRFGLLPGHGTPYERQPGTPIVQTILLEGLDTTVLFGLSFPRSIDGDFLTLQTDGMGSLFLPVPSTGRTQYTVWSTPVSIREADRAATSFTYPEEIRRHFLQLPPLPLRVAQLAQEATAGASTPYLKALALSQYLQRHFRYSLDVGRGQSSKPLEQFLFVRKTGYCEHYATAMVILLRTLGIPARLVTGFLPGEWNEFGRYYTVRQRDAHAWVEAYFPQSGWVTFDPTPSVGSAGHESWWTAWVRMVDSFRVQWDRLIVQYSARDQLAVVQSLRESTHSLRTEVTDLLVSTFSEWLLRAQALAQFLQRSQWYAAAALSGALLVGWFLWRVPVRLLVEWLRGRSTDVPTQEETAAQQVYVRTLQILRARGYCKPAWSTPHEFLHNVGAEWKEAEPIIASLTEFYCRVRFGGTTFTLRDLRQADEWLTRLRALPSRQP